MSLEAKIDTMISWGRNSEQILAAAKSWEEYANNPCVVKSTIRHRIMARNAKLYLNSLAGKTEKYSKPNRITRPQINGHQDYFHRDSWLFKKGMNNFCYIVSHDIDQDDFI